MAGAGGSFLPQFLKHCATGINAVTGNVGTRLDLVSFHAKGGVAIVGDHVEMDLRTQLRLHRAGFNAVAAVPQFSQTPIYVTEADPDGCAACPVSTTPADAYRTSPAYGAYEIAMMKHSLELEAEVGVKLGGLLTWAFTFPGTPYFAGYRTLATNGINLPVMGAFELLGRLDGTRMPLTSSGARTLDDILTNGVRGEPDVDGMATLNGPAVQVLVWNYHDDIVTAAATPVHLAVKVPASFGALARVSHLRLDESHGDAYTRLGVARHAGQPVGGADRGLAGSDGSLAAGPGPDRRRWRRTVPSASTSICPGSAFRWSHSSRRLWRLTAALPPTARWASAVTAAAANGGGGCGCRVGGRGDGAASSAATLLGLGAMVIVMVGRRRRSAKCTDRT